MYIVCDDYHYNYYCTYCIGYEYKRHVLVTMVTSSDRL